MARPLYLVKPKPLSGHGRRFFFDIETNGLLDVLDAIHSIVLMDADTGEIFSAHDQQWENPREREEVTTVPIRDAVIALSNAAELIGHNIMDFDIPAIRKVYPAFDPHGRVTDTLVLSRLIFADLKERDFDFRRKRTWFPGRLIGSHSLEAWGLRLGNKKGDFGKDTHNTKDDDTWAFWSPEMQTYCEQDVAVTKTLYDRLMKKGFSEESIWLEHRFKEVMIQQEAHGFPFDVPKAEALAAKLIARRAELEQQLQEAFPPWEIRTPFLPKANNKKLGYQKGVWTEKVKTVVFNPASRKHIADRLIALRGWEPTETTPSGEPKVDEETLSKLPWPEAELLTEYLMVQKRLGQLAEGDQAWLKLQRNGRIHGRVTTNGAITGRCTHQNPNVAQTPSLGAPYGAECRELFTVLPGYKLVGADASGLELRALAHFMARYDGGAYAHILLEGDIHWANVQAMGLTGEERDEENPIHKAYRDGAKTFIYGFLYGAGDEKVGRIVFDIIVKLKANDLPYQDIKKRFFGNCDTPGSAEFKKAGKRLKTKFLKGLPALKRLREQVQEAVKRRGYLRGLDGRKLYIRSAHAALNTLLQSAGGLAVKLATVFLYDNLCKSGYVFGKDFAFVAHVHDEYQLMVRAALAEEIGQMAVDAIKQAGDYFKFRCPLDGEYKIGNNWKETH